METPRQNCKLNSKEATGAQLKTSMIIGKESNTDVIVRKCKNTDEVLILHTKHVGRPVEVKRNSEASFDRGI